MAVQAGQLLIVRRRLTLVPGTTTINTGLRQANIGVEPDPPLGGSNPSIDDPDGVASRVMVAPLAPIDPWVDSTVLHGEPRLDVDTGTVVVDFDNHGEADVLINVMFWDPHTLASPIDADTYLDLQCETPTTSFLDSEAFSIEVADAPHEVVVAAPGSLETGNLMIFALQVTMDDSLSSPDSTPGIDEPGWTLHEVVENDFGGDSGMKLAIYWRIATDADIGASYTVSYGDAVDGGLTGYLTVVHGIGFDDVAPFVSAGALTEAPEDPLSMAIPQLVVTEDQAPALAILYAATSSISFADPLSISVPWLGVVSALNSTSPGGGLLRGDLGVPSDAGATPAATLSQNDLAGAIAYLIVVPQTCTLQVNGEVFNG